MFIICFNQMGETDDGRVRVCGAVQMTGFNGAQHTLRQDLPCRGCGEAGHYDGYFVKLTDNEHNVVVNGDITPVREL